MQLRLPSPFRLLLATVWVVLLGTGLAVELQAGGLDEWAVRLGDATNDWLAVTFGAGKFVTVGAQGGIMTSSNGLHWNSAGSPTSLPLRGVTHAAGRYVAVGAGGTILVSSNASDWTPRSAGTTGELFQVVYGGAQFVTVGRLDTGSNFMGIILTSPDGEAWTARDSGIFNPLYAVAYDAGRYVAVGHLSAVASINGVDWAPVGVPNYAPVFALAAGNGHFVSGQNDVYTPRYPFSVCENPYFWRGATADTEGTAWGLTFGNGMFAAVGGLFPSFDNATNHFAISPDGEQWTTHPLGEVPALHGVAYGRGTFVTVGLAGTILQSGRVDAPRLAIRSLPGQSFVQVTLQGEPDFTYRLQASTNLTSGGWTDVLTITNLTGTVTLTNVPVAAAPQQFYRAVSP